MSFLKGIQSKVSNTINSSGSGKQQEQQDDRSLATLLDRQQRAELTILVSQVIEIMRNESIRVFDEKLPAPPSKKAETDDAAVELSKLTVADTGAVVDPSEADQAGSKGKDGEKSITAEEAEANAIQSQADEAEATLIKNATPELRALRSAALAFFDTWAESVILRVGEVVNSRDHQDQPQSQQHKLSLQPESTEPAFRPTPGQQSVQRTLKLVFPPTSTSLKQLSHLERSAIVNAVLLLLLSLESYRAHSRTLLIRLCTSLDITVAELSNMEKDTALGLLKIAEATGNKPSAMDASASTAKAQEASSTARKWKIGAAGVAGAALIGITGGLAAPLIAAGVGTVMGGLGLGATAAAGYLGALAGNAALVGGLFGAYGARMTSRTMDKFAKEIEDFAFIPIDEEAEKVDREERQRNTASSESAPPPLPPRGSPSHRSSLIEQRRNSAEQKRQAAAQKERESNRHRLHLTIGISGWLTSPSQVTSPWLVLSHPSTQPNTDSSGAEPFALRWELSALLALGSALRDLVLSQAWSQLRKELIKRTVLAALYSALMAPLAIRKVIKLVDSPFGIAKIRAMKAGEVLADALIERVQGERPVSLIGMSLGGRVLYSCLLTLARRQAFGLVENVVFMGAACPSDEEAWRSIRSVVSGRVINVFSTQDYILALLYRTSSAQFGIAGLQRIEGVVGVESFDASEVVGGHLKYMGLTGRVLEMVGWEDLDEREVKRRAEEAEKDEVVEAEEGSDDEDDRGKKK
jgi:hypothetical protein